MRGGPISSSRKSFGSLPSWCGELRDERLGRPGVHHIVHRPEPADADMRLRLAALHPDVRNVERRIDPSHAELDRARMLRIGHEVRHEGRRSAAMPPRDHLVVRVESRLEAISGHGVIEAVLDVVLARPHDLYRRAADLLRKQGGLDREVALRLAAEPAAQQRAVDRHLLGLDAERFGDVVARAAGALHWRPDLPSPPG